MKATIYHNPRCSKSRQTLALLQEHGVEVDIIEYLKTPPDVATLGTIIDKLGIDAADLLRKKETAYKELDLKNKHDNEEALLQAMVEYPVLIERPIVLVKDRAALGRPPENILGIIK